MGSKPAKPSRGRAPLPESYRKRTYRERVHTTGLVAFRVVCEQTDLLIQAERPLADEAREHVLDCRGQIAGYIRRYPEFATTLVPWPNVSPAPLVVRQMIHAGQAAGVGPMAAVAGAIAESVGRGLLEATSRIVVENGGDLFVKSDAPLVAGIFAGASPLSMKMGLKIPDTGDGLGLCTSSGTVGHSLSRGVADAVCVVARSSALADAAATAIGNRIQRPGDIDGAIQSGRGMGDILGIVVVVGRQMGAWGSIELVPLNRKKG
ncbi:UPF0280 family protein [Desulfosarcina ovata]|uniref:Thiamine biosynthesis protein ApbE n=2 Tax=Desulfosarcina ovata TaxID=83564 RepID=A0A5K8A6Z5_9BACT|nr:UPF0280 family protein [Desulfosarcina ovata]BBO79686.1 thiamine biosynthesis protein ApbE [Desulfosarcina ovata subsp. sediminis]BBO88382.1 thiamine biosynthesis protein ApbE [Desulfosarcina ovata subsp. ovata]